MSQTTELTGAQRDAMHLLEKEGYAPFDPREHTIRPGVVVMVRDGYFRSIRPDGVMSRPARLP